MENLNDELYNYFNIFVEKFLRDIILDISHDINNNRDVNDVCDIPINITKIHYRKINSINTIHYLIYNYNSITSTFDYRENVNLENFFDFINNIFDKYGIKYNYQCQKKELRYWKEEQGVLTLHTSLKTLLTMYEDEVQKYAERFEKTNYKNL